MALTQYRYSDLTAEQRAALCLRPGVDIGDAIKVVTPIAEAIKSEGDAALTKFTKQFDGADLQGPEFLVSPEEIEASATHVSEEFKSSLAIAITNVRKFHELQGAQASKGYSVETSPGVKCSRKFTPLEAIGIYVPAGSAALYSSMYMAAIPAQIAGCERLVVCIPPNTQGEVIPEMLYTAKVLGITEVYKAGGAQAIFAMAYGTETIKPVYKIFGPGNQYVVAAKYIASLTCGDTDMVAGPTEAMVIADASSNHEFIAADLLAQAEHGVDSQVVLVTVDETVIAGVQEAVNRQTQALERKEEILGCLENSFALVCETIEEVMAFANAYAAEHLLIGVDDYQPYEELVRNAGSVFLGHLTPESAGDYASGTNHVLPTSGSARYAGGLKVEDCGKYVTFQTITPEGLKNVGPAVEVLARGEGLDAHANAATVRLQKLEDAK